MFSLASVAHPVGKSSSNEYRFTDSDYDFEVFPLFYKCGNDLLGWAIIGGGDSVKCVEVILGAVVQLILP